MSVLTHKALAILLASSAASLIGAGICIKVLNVVLTKSSVPDAATGVILAVTLGLALLSFPVLGALIAIRRPANSIGWLFCTLSLIIAVSLASAEYADHALRLSPGTWPSGEWMEWLANLTYAPALGIIGVFLPLLFPDGAPPSSRWRLIGWLGAGGVLAHDLSTAFNPGPLYNSSVANPAGIDGFGGVLGATQDLAFLVLIAAIAVAVASHLWRFHSSVGEERLQLKWFALSAFCLSITLPFMGEGIAILEILAALAIVTVPAATAVAILKYRLYNIDLIINRTLVYCALTSILFGIYGVTVLGLGQLLESLSSFWVSMVGAGLVAALVQPLRQRLQGGVNRLLYGQRDEPYTIVQRLGRRLEEIAVVDEVLPAVAEIIADALKLSYAAIAFRAQEGEAIYSFPPHIASRPTDREVMILPLVYHGEHLGELILAARQPGDALDTRDRTVVEGLVQTVGAAVYVVRLSGDLQRSRERLVLVREEERRRLRRDLHDGLGPQLASLIMNSETARNLLRTDAGAADEILLRLKSQSQAALADIRRLAYEFRPASLDQLGLVSAIQEYAGQHFPAVLPGRRRKGLLQVIVEADQLPPLPAAVEVAAYRIVMEAVTNTVRHSGATSCVVRIRIEGGLKVEVEDDGRGIPEDARPGIGIASMRERAAELGGAFRINSHAQGGTFVAATLPLPMGELSS